MSNEHTVKSYEEELRYLIEKELQNKDVNQIDTPRHTITVDDFSFRSRLKKELNSSLIT